MRTNKNIDDYLVGITRYEIQGLSGLPYLHQALYINLRAKACYITGIVGGKEGQRISLQAIREWLYVEPGQGIKNSGSPSISQIRTAISGLERAGLVESRSIVTKSVKKLILYLPLAVKDKFTQNKVSMFSTHQSSTEHEIVKNVETSINSKANSQENIKFHKEGSTLETAKVGTPLNNIYKYTHSTTACLKKSIIAHYQPSAEIMKKAEELDLLKFHSELELQKFISYYKSNEIQVADWDHKYLGWLINAKQFQQQNGDAQHAKRQQRSYTTSRKALSAVDEVRKRNQIFSKNTIIDAEIDNEGRYFPSVGESDPSFWS